MLASDYGLSLEYHGLLAAQPWPLLSDLEWERLAGLPSPDAKSRFATWFAHESPDYFVVQNLEEFDAQPDLKAFLGQNFRILAQTDRYLIFYLHR